MQGKISQFLEETYLQWIGIGFAISLLIWVAMRIRAHFRDESDDATDNHLLLNQFRDLYREGDLTDEEYRKLKSRISTSDDATEENRSSGSEGPPPTS